MERSKPIRTLLPFVGLLLAAATVAGGYELGISDFGFRISDCTRQSTIRNPQSAIRNAQCGADADCDDGNACTFDSCIDKECVHEKIPGCAACGELICPPIDLVFVMDTSGSMKDEAGALCEDLAQVLADLAGQGIIVNPTLLGIIETPGGLFACLGNDVVTLLGDAVPGKPGPCPFPDGAAPNESWGPATAIVAARFPWTDGALRVIVPLSDEGPCNGSIPEGCNDPGDDRDSITNAIAVANAHDVVVSPITGSGTGACVEALAADLAAGTGGVAGHSEKAGTDLAPAIADLVRAACNTVEECDDTDVCTVNDTCVDGVCMGIDVETIECLSDAECFGSICEPKTGFCVCADMPELRLTAGAGGFPDEQCHEVGSEIVMSVELGYSFSSITGGQFLIGYDPSILGFVRIEPGSEVDPSSPFSEQVYESIDEVTGRIFYAVTVPLGDGGTQGPAVMASLRFVALAPCSTIELCFLNENPLSTRLTDENGFEVPFLSRCTGELFITVGPPVLDCPESVAVNADAGAVTALVTWDPSTVTDVCDGDAELSCSASHSLGLDIDHLIETGGVFPVGLAEFECTTTGRCGTVPACSWSVEVSLENSVVVDLELSPIMVDGPLQRCIEFEFFASCLEGPVRVTQLVDFGPPHSFPGHARNVTVKVAADQYACVTARDPKHTLRSVSELETDGTIYMASFEGAPFFGGNWLVGGNLNGDHVIDILDFGILVSDYLTQVDPVTDCATPGFHADISGDGLIDQIDLSFVIQNYLEHDKDACCPGGRAGSPSVPVTQISIPDLEAMGLGRLRSADLNQDGLLNADDIAAFLRGRMPLARE